jgi:ABC-type glycerol-3-phosphate transport system substrate-binding protein
MKLISRRQVLGGVGAAVAAGTGLKPRRARAAGELTVWWTQGFYKAENDAVIAWMADWEKRNNTKVNLTIMNGPDVITKLIAGMQVGDVPDVVHTVTGDRSVGGCLRRRGISEDRVFGDRAEQCAPS